MYVISLHFLISHKHTVKIQSIWRGTREIAKLREQARISWNPEFSSNLPLTTQLQNLTRLLLFFYRDTPSDNERLDKLCTIFLSNLSSNSKSTGKYHSYNFLIFRSKHQHLLYHPDKPTTMDTTSQKAFSVMSKKTRS